MFTWREMSQSILSTSLSLSPMESMILGSFSSRASRTSLSMFLTSTFILSTDLAGLISPWSIRSLMTMRFSLSSRISRPMAVWVNDDAVLAAMYVGADKLPVEVVAVGDAVRIDDLGGPGEGCLLPARIDHHAPVGLRLQSDSVILLQADRVGPVFREGDHER